MEIRRRPSRRSFGSRGFNEATAISCGDPYLTDEEQREADASTRPQRLAVEILGAQLSCTKLVSASTRPQRLAVEIDGLLKAIHKAIDASTRPQRLAVEIAKAESRSDE